MATPAYCNALDLRDALDVPAGPRDDLNVARAIADASRHIERQCNGRRFYPETATRTIDWGDRASVNTAPRKLWLDEHELTSISALSVNGTTIGPAYYRLGPTDTSGPYRWIELGTDSTVRFSYGTGDHRDVVSITGEFGYPTTTTTPAALAAAIADSAATSITVDNGAQIAAGDLLGINSERLIVTASTWVDTGENLTAALTADTADTTLTVSGTYTPGERLLVGSERLRVREVAGSTIVVDRRADRTPLSAHSIGADLYALRGFTVERGQLGTTAATHLTAAPVGVVRPPDGIRSWAIAEAIAILANERAGYARTVGAGEAEREASGRSLAQVRRDGSARYGAKGRHYATSGPTSIGAARW